MAIAAGLLASESSLPSAETLAVPEYKLKAGFIYNFAKLTRWPADAFVSKRVPLIIGVAGADPLVGYLEQETKGRFVEGRTVRVLRISNPAEASTCHVLFISISSENNLQNILNKVVKRPVLTISEIDRFTRSGGMIRLYRSGGALRFEVRKAAADLAGLEFSSKLLALANLFPEPTR